MLDRYKACRNCMQRVLQSLQHTYSTCTRNNGREDGGVVRNRLAPIFQIFITPRDAISFSVCQNSGNDNPPTRRVRWYPYTIRAGACVRALPVRGTRSKRPFASAYLPPPLSSYCIVRVVLTFDFRVDPNSTTTRTHVKLRHRRSPTPALLSSFSSRIIIRQQQ